jgi:hypothetical protein
MADLVQFGPFTVYKSPAYEEAVRQRQANAATEQEYNKTRLDLTRNALEEAIRKQEYEKSPEGQAALRNELEKSSLAVENARLEMADKQEKQRRAAPEYAPMEAARLSRVKGTLEEDLASQRELMSSAGNRIQDLQSASAPLPAGVPGPVMERDMASQLMRPALELEADMKNRAIATEAATAATNRQLGEVVGTLPVPEGLGGGTAPVTSDIGMIYKQRLEQLVPMKAGAISYINSLPVGSPERMAAEQTVGEMSGYQKAETKRIAENTLKIPGLEGMANTEQGAKAVREKVPEFVSAVAAIDELMRLGKRANEEKLAPDRARLMIRAEEIRTILSGQMRVLFGGGGVQSDQDVIRLQKAIPDSTAIVNFGAQDSLGELKKMLGRGFVSTVRANGYQIKSVQSIIDANADPEDIGSFGVKRKTEFNNEAEARAAGYGNNDIITINKQQFKLSP